MSKVHILPPEIVSKIAAGEVIERPASCIKELSENALDAGTETLDISIKDSGKTLIQVKDTGSGIEPDDIENLFLRHSTSKLQNYDDLFAIRSLGFRGEALYSIASISDITLRSKTKSNDSGWEIHLRGGERINLTPVAMKDGTEIEVRELFFNTPARKKFLKTATTELHEILNLFIPYTLLYPGKRFSLSHNDKSIIDLAPEKDYVTRVSKALKFKSEHIIETKKEFPDNEISIHLLLGDINIQRPRKDMQFIFINGRPVRNHLISYHLNQIYNLIFPKEVRPFFIVSLTNQPENIDVNIHPTKLEVKIKNESTIVPLLRTLCEHTLMTYGKPREVSGTTFSYTHQPSIESEDIYPKYKDKEIIREKQLTFPQETIPTVIENMDLKNKLLLSNYIGSFLKKYLFFESGTSLLIIDQHAAQERISYEELLDNIQIGSIEIQRLLTPILLQLTPQETLIWERLKDTLELFGLETSLWDNENIAIHTHPNLIKNPEIALRNILSEKDIKHFDVDTVARRACRGSIMSGDKLALEEVQYLMKKLMECKDPFVCPHGRPTVIEIKERLFEKEFLRK